MANIRALDDALALFAKLPTQNILSWNFALRTYARKGQGQQVLHLFNQMQQQGVMPNRVTFVCIFSSYASRASLPAGKQMHARIQGSKFEVDVVVGTAIVSMYGKCGSLEDARRMFDWMPSRDVVSWNAMIALSTQQGLGKDALEIFDKMQHETLLMPTKATFVTVLAACANQADLAQGRRIHSHIQDGKFELDVGVGTALVNMYGKCDSVMDAWRTFETMPERNAVSWNVMISLCAQHGQCGKALQLFNQMQKEEILLDSANFASVLAACSSPIALPEGERLHTRILNSGLELDVVLGNALINMYGKCGNLEGAQKTFDIMPERNVVSWTTIIAVNAQNNHGTESLKLFEQLQQTGIKPNHVTFISVLDACTSEGNLSEGMRLHVHVLDNGCEADVVIGNSLINMYGKCGSLTDAQKLFYKMPERDVISWNAIITVYSHQGQGKDALRLFKEMQQLMIPNRITFVSILDACSSYSTLGEGKQIHICIVDNGFESDLAVGTALVSMYGRCCSLEDARRVFDIIPEPNVVCWTALIEAYAQLRRGKEAMQLIDQMQEEGVEPTKLTFISILAAFSNREAIIEGKQVCARIIDCGLESDVMVGNALLSMYGKCGCIEDAQIVFDKILERDIVSWNSMVAAYAQCGLVKKALQLCEQMQWEGLMPNQVTFLNITDACPGQLALSEGKRLHCNILGSKCKLDSVMGTILLNMYNKCGSPKEALEVFNEMHEHDIISWTAMIAAHAQHGQVKEALELFDQMQRGGVTPNDITFSNIITACSHTGLVNVAFVFFNSMMPGYGISPDVDHYVGMIDLLGRAGQMDQAEYLINDMPFQPTAVPYMAMLSACRQPADIDRGERAARQVVELDSGNPAPYIMLSNMYAADDRWIMERI